MAAVKVRGERRFEIVSWKSQLTQESWTYLRSVVTISYCDTGRDLGGILCNSSLMQKKKGKISEALCKSGVLVTSWAAGMMTSKPRGFQT